MIHTVINFGSRFSKYQSVNSTPTLTIYNQIYSGHHGNLLLAQHYWKQAKVTVFMPTNPSAHCFMPQGL